MSPRDWFWFLAGALVTFTITLTVRRWPRERPAQFLIPSFAVSVAAGLALLGVALGIYFLLGSPQPGNSAHEGAATAAATPAATPLQQTPPSSANAGSLDEVTRKLATRLATKGGSDSEWKLLAESYDYMGRAADAKAARAHMAVGASTIDARGSASVGVEQMAAVADALDSKSAPSPAH